MLTRQNNKPVYFIKLFFYLFFILLLLLFFSCSPPDDTGGTGDGGGGEEDDDEEDDEAISIQNLNATVFEHDDKIGLSWDRIMNIDYYKIYRYESETDSLPDEFTSELNEYNDFTAVIDTPYFYKVSPIINNSENEISDYVFGLRGSVIDEYERNDEVRDDLNTTFITDPIIYCCPDGNNGYEADIDWYKYHFIRMR